MAEVKEYFFNNNAYSLTSKVYEWLNISSTNSLYIIIFSDSDFVTTVDYAIDSNFEVIDSESQNTAASTSRKLVLYAKTRFIRLTVSGLTNPCILRTQAFFHSTSVINSTSPEYPNVPLLVDAQCTKTAFGSIATESQTPKRQYNFTRGITGTYLTGKTAYGDTRFFDSSAGGINFNFDSGYLCITGFNTVNYAHCSGAIVRYQPGQSIVFRSSTGFYQGSKNVGFEGCTIQLEGIGNISNVTNKIRDGAFFGYGNDLLPYHPDNFGVCYFNNSVKTFIPRTGWNKDKCDGNGSSGINIQDWSLIQGFQIHARNTADLSFYVINPDTGYYVLVHHIVLVNVSASPSFYSPSFGYIKYQEITALNQPVGLTDKHYTPTAGIFLEGEILIPYERIANINRNFSLLADTEMAVISVRCKTTFLGKQNYMPLIADYASFTCSGTKGFLCCFWRNALDINTAVWTAPPASGGLYELPVEYDKVGTFLVTPVQSELLVVTTVDKEGRVDVNLRNYNIEILPGEILTMTSRSINAGTVDCSLCVTTN